MLQWSNTQKHVVNNKKKLPNGAAIKVRMLTMIPFTRHYFWKSKTIPVKKKTWNHIYFLKSLNKNNNHLEMTENVNIIQWSTPANIDKSLRRRPKKILCLHQSSLFLIYFAIQSEVRKKRRNMWEHGLMLATCCKSNLHVVEYGL